MVEVVVDERIKLFDNALLRVSERKLFKSSQYPESIVILFDTESRKVLKFKYFNISDSKLNKALRKDLLFNAIVNAEILRKGLLDREYCVSSGQFSADRIGALMSSNYIVSSFGLNPNKNFYESISGNILDKLSTNDDFYPVKRYLQNNMVWLFSYN